MHDEVCKIFESIKEILAGELNSDAVTEVRDAETERITIFLLTLYDLAYTYDLLGKYKESYEMYEILFQEVIKFSLPSIDKKVLTTEFFNLATYENIEKSENYLKILCFSDESRKYLDILKIMCSIAYDKVSYGKKQAQNESYKSAEKCYDEALKICIKACYCRSKSKRLAVSKSSVIRILRQITYVSNTMAWFLSTAGRENHCDTTGSQQDCCETALCYYYFTLVRNTSVYEMQKEMYWPSHPAVVKSIKNIIKVISRVAFLYNTTGSKKSGKEKEKYHRKALDMYLKIDEVLSSGVREMEVLISKNRRDIEYTSQELRDKKGAEEIPANI